MPTTPDTYQPTEEIQEIIGQVPSRVIRWGITAFLGTLLLIVGLSRYLYLPFLIQAEANLSAREQFFRIVWMKTDPAVDYRILVKEGSLVKKNDTLMVESNSQTGVKVFHTTTTKGRVLFFRGTEEMPRASVIVVAPPFSDYVVELKVPISGAGQLKRGQKVIIRLDEFPESKYGFLIGKVATTTLLPIDNFYRIKVHLNNGMTTNVHQQIPVQASLHGKADIITENVSIFNKIFSGLL